MSFLNPLFLIGLAAAALPVLYHLVRRMKAKHVPFSSLMFLTTSPKEVVRRRRLKDLLLMAVRAALFALLALAFARPFIPREQIPFIPQREDRSVVLLVDASYSMQYDDRFAAAKQEALEWLNEAEGADEFAVVVFSNQVQQLTAFDADLATHRSVVGGLEASSRPTDVYAALRRAEEVLQDAQHNDRRIVLVSDFQRAGWSRSLENWKLDAAVGFVPVQVDSGAASNAYVEAFNLTKRRAGRQTAVRFDAQTAARGEAAEAGRDVQLTVAGEAAGSRSVPPGASGRVSFEQMAPREEAASYQGTLALAGDDGLALDDQFYFTYEVAPRPSILVVDGGSGARRDAFFLQSAFDTGDEARYAFNVSTPERLGSGGLQGQDVVFLANVATLTEAQVRDLRRYAESGGSVVVSFGETVDLPAFSQRLRELGIGTVEGAVTPRLVQGADAIIGEVDLRHPVFSVFTGAGAILRPTFRRYADVRPDSAATVLGRYDTGDPFLLERRLGQGRVLVYTATFNTDWTDFPIDESYIPFVYQLAAYATRRSETQRQFQVGEVVAVEGRPGETVDVRAPGNRFFKLAIGEGGTGFFRETEVPGQYVAATGRAPFYFSVNVDPAESDLDVRDVNEAYAAVVPPSDSARTSAQAGGGADVANEEAQQKLWRYLVLLVIALFVLETILANRRSGAGRKRVATGASPPQPSRRTNGRPAPREADVLP
ncbi:MAG: BatA domain-containing protein [Rhodothermales bacterium]